MPVISDVQVVVQTNGTSGPRGNSVLSGDGAPDDSLGFDGDYYVDVSEYPTEAVFYGPKAAGAWPTQGITLTNGSGPSPSSTVTTEETFAQSSTPGVAATYSRGDHTHGTPPTTGLVTLAGGGQLTASLSSTIGAFGSPLPINQGLKAWVCDPAAVGNAALAVNGTTYLSAVYVAESFTTTSVFWHVSSAGVTPTSGENYIGIYDFSGTLLGSAPIDADYTTTGTKLTSLSVPLVAGHSYWVAFLFNAATPPQMPRPAGTSITGISTLLNVNLTPATYRLATNGTGRTTLLNPIVPNSNVIASGYWAALT